MFKFKEKEEESPTVKYKEKYDIFADKEALNSLENEIRPYGDFYKMCEAKGWIRIIYRDVTIDFTVNPETVSYFTDYCARDKARTKRIQYFLEKQKEADKQRLIPAT